MAKSKAEKLAEVHARALSQFAKIQTTYRPERKQCLEDRRFCTIPGAQWEGQLAEQYANKPKFEVNKVHLSVIRIINDYRNNKIACQFIPKKASDDELAELCNGMFRADQFDSDGQEAFDNSFEEAVQGGFGAFRLRADYEDEYDEDNETQRIRIEPIYDADISVFFDMDAKRQDKADAKFCYVISSMTPEAYKEKYDDDPSTWPREINMAEFDWYSPDVLYVAEYYEVEEAYDTKVYFDTIFGEEECYWLYDLDDDKLEELTALGSTETHRRKIRRKKVHKYILSGGKVLEDCGFIAGKEIPIVPVYGKRWYIENIERCMGHVRLSKDAQRLKNMQLSKLGEVAALSSVEKPILMPEQIAGNERMWSEDNLKDYPYLLVNPITDAEGNTVPSGPIAYTKPASIPPALGALLTITEEDMRDILGRYEQGDELKTHISGEAVDKIHARLDMQTYIYMSNFAKALKRCGEVWLSMAKDIYIEDERDVKVMDEEGPSETRKIRVKRIGDTGEIEVANDLEKAAFDVNVDIGPSSNSRRDAIVRQATAMMQYSQDPTDQQVLSSMAMMNMQGEGMADTREYFRKKLVKMGVVKPTERDQAEMQPDEPSPQDQFALGEAERAKAEAAKYRADTIETIANAQLKKAQAQEILMRISTPAQKAEVKEDFKEEELLLNAKVQAETINLKRRELDLKERELVLKSNQGSNL